MSATGDTLSFLLAWAAAPLRVGALAPSGASLAGLMTHDIGVATGPVLELGPGTGPFTRALVARGVREEELTLVEADPDFAAILRRRFPKARIVETDAAALGGLPLYDRPTVGAAVSGLPFRLISPRKAKIILEAVFANMRPGAALYQYTFGWRCPIDQSVLVRLDLDAERIGHTYRNFPPATVYRITKINTARWDWRFK